MSDEVETIGYKTRGLDMQISFVDRVDLREAKLFIDRYLQAFDHNPTRAQTYNEVTGKTWELCLHEEHTWVGGLTPATQMCKYCQKTRQVEPQV